MALIGEPSPSPRLLGLCGYKYAGKSTAGLIAAEAWGFERTRLAWPIKAAAIGAGVPVECVDGPREAKERPLALLDGASGREFQERLGDWGRATFGAEFWLRGWAERAEALLGAGRALILVDDVRYDLEDDFLAAWAEAHGLPYLLIHVSAPDREDQRASHETNRVPDPARVARCIDNARATCPDEGALRARVTHALGAWDARLRAGLAPASGRTPRW